MGVGDREVGGMDRGGEFVAICAVADEGVDEAGAVGWLGVGSESVLLEGLYAGTSRLPHNHA